MENGLISEHEKATITTSSGTYTPTDEERKALKLVDKLFSKAKKHKSKYDEKWADYYKMFRGKQWAEQRPSYRHSEVINFIFQSIQSTIPILTDSKPRIEFIPENPQDMEFSKILSDCAESDWERGNWLYQLTESLYDAHFYGAGFGGLNFKPKYGADGEICMESQDPFYLFPDPSAMDCNKDCEFFIKAEPVEISKLKKDYPDKKDYIKSDLNDSNTFDKTNLQELKYMSPTDRYSHSEGHTQDSSNSNKVLKITCYTKSDEFDEEEKKEIDENGVEQVSYVQKLKYPMGRKICVAGGVVLSDGPFEYEHGKWPFARFTNYILPREFWGISDVEQLASPQKIFNKLVSYALDVLVLMGNPIWKVGTGAGVDTDNLINRPGLILEAEDITQVQREEGVQLQPYVLQLIDRMANWFDGISGANEVTRGVKPEGITAGVAISSLQEAAQQRLRLKSRNIDAGLKDLGQQYLGLALQFYTAPKVFRITDDQNAQKYFKMHVENQPDGTKKAIVRNYSQTADGQYAEDLEAKEYIINGSFDVRVTTGSSLPFAKEEKANLAFKLLEAGAIDQLELLKAVDYPNGEAVYQRMQEQKMQEQQMQMDAQMQMQAAKQGGQQQNASPQTGAPPAA